MGQKISEHRQDWEFLLPLLPNLCCTSSPLAFTEGTIIFFQILKLLSGYLQWSIQNFNRITLYCHRRLSLRLDAYVWLSYFLTALSHRSASLLETHPLTGLITQSLKWCIPYIYITSSSTLTASVWKSQGFHYHQSFCRDHSTWIFL